MTKLRQREPRQVDKAFLAFVREKACCVCGHHPPNQAAHIRMADFGRGKRHTGMGEKSSDRWCVPLCAGCHLDNRVSVHKMGEQRFWWEVGLDPFVIAIELYAEFGSVD